MTAILIACAALAVSLATWPLALRRAQRKVNARHLQQIARMQQYMCGVRIRIQDGDGDTVYVDVPALMVADMMDYINLAQLPPGAVLKVTVPA